MISIIVPVYNASVYLDACLESIHRQSFKDWECIIVDDGSTDGSDLIAAKWKERDCRFKYIRQSNQGPASERNCALNLSSGELIAFIDADDHVDQEYLSVLYELLVGRNVEISVCGMTAETGSRAHRIFSSSFNGVVSIKEDTSVFVRLCENNLMYGPVIKLYKRSIIDHQNARFDERYDYGEDLMFNLSYLKGVNNIAVSAATPYHYRRHSNDTLSTRFREDQFQIDYAQWKAIFSFFEDSGILNDTAKQYLYRRLWGAVYDGVFQYPKVMENKPGYLKRILSIPEISSLKAYSSVFDCSHWIKNLIITRNVRGFEFYFKSFYNK